MLAVWAAWIHIAWLTNYLDPRAARLVAWGGAILVMYVVTATGFPLPGLGHAMTTDYPISGEHFAHRCYLFITIALGETILVIGTQFA